MKKTILLLLIIFSSSQIQAQSNEMWTKVSESTTSITERGNAPTYDTEKAVYKLDEAFLKEKLSSTLLKTGKKNTVEITIPNMDGAFEKYTVWESSNFDAQLQAKYPDIRAYEGISSKDKKARIHFSVSPRGIQTMVLRADNASEFIESVDVSTDEYILFTAKNRGKGSLPLTCNTKEVALNQDLKDKTAKIAANNKVFKTLRLALSCTGEYAVFFGGTKANALEGINATMTRVNGVFNKDLALKLVLIANNDAVIYTNAATDPYSDASDGVKGKWPQELQTTLTNVIGESAYDIGHLFGASGGGGDAGCVGCVCEDSVKGSGYTSPSDRKPQGDTFDIDFVSHEMGHQLGANHTFSYSIEGSGVNVEPGSGSTIMGYTGITGDYDIQDHSDDYFAYASILQIQNNLARKTCPVDQALTNSPPVINAGADYTIPFKTAFVLKGTGSDVDGNSVTYCWEQNDSAVSTSGSASVAKPDKPDGPLFRSLPPSSTPIRYMPDLNIVLSGNLISTWESVPSVARTLHFTLTGRNNAALGTAQTNTDEMTVNVRADIGPFVVTSQNKDDIEWLHGTSQIITWDVAKTNTLTGSANVNIKLSTDGGLTFPIVLAANTPNDGSQTISVPEDITATNCRILIEPTANIYYAVNSKSFAIGYKVESSCTTYPINAGFTIPTALAYASRTITVPADSGIVSDVNVFVGLTHTRFSDIQMELVNPQGKAVRLFDKDCGNTSGSLLLKYDDLGGALDCSNTILQTIAPKDLLSGFNNQEGKGTWTFKVRDIYVGKDGKLDSASIEICTKKYTLQTEDVVEIIDLTVFPIPNKGEFDIAFKSESNEEIRVFIYNDLGKEVYRNSFESMVNFKEHIQLKNHVAPGVYFMAVYDGDRKMVKKIVFE
ncbi:proprotein convertase P-domain-containing protein [Flavobacterium sp. ALJ2]|uniref:reprolysin-like metallopeptidase n=1 Tax=Flavobacterium sp. ALJ2 TaxID=2786960 RepID=UPI00189E32CA|nr:zinc-dependent metalloprotease family protein [Flavobacterium sp. ALJ2]MBF7091011.1 proprotein convertase P-domain-containing protein [Flavobacterium sp. ALJ2]